MKTETIFAMISDQFAIALGEAKRAIKPEEYTKEGAGLKIVHEHAHGCYEVEYDGPGTDSIVLVRRWRALDELAYLLKRLSHYQNIERRTDG